MKKLTAVSSFVALTLGATALQASSLLFEEAFEAASLDSGWSWLREDPAGWKLEYGRLRIRTNGQLWESKNNQKNVLLRQKQEGAGGKLVAEITVDGHLELDKAYEHGGLIWYLDDDNWVTLTLLNHVAHKTQKLLLISEVEGEGLADSSVAIPFLDRSVTLRLVVEGRNFTGMFRRTDSTTWEELGTITFEVTGQPRIGLVAGQGNEDDEHWVAFDDFRILR